MARRPVIAANWKMHKTIQETRDFLARFLPAVAGRTGVDIVICPPFTALAAAGEMLAGTGVALGAQDVHWEERGAFTGEVSPAMLADVGSRYVIVGHSERRALFGEGDAEVNRKARAVLAHNLTPIVCVGETLAQREAGLTDDIVVGQLEAALAGLDAGQVARIIVAYEPVWAIGTGRAATPKDASAVASRLRGLVAGKHGDTTAAALRIQYGGSVKAANSGEFLADSEIDGALVGGASLDPAEFAAIVASAPAGR